MKLCKDCKHYDNIKCFVWNDRENPVFGGEVSGIDAGLMRLTACGWEEPKLFEPREEK